MTTTVTFAKAFRRHVDCPDETFDHVTSDDGSAEGGMRLSALLDDYFERHPAVRTYVLDDTGALRRHVTVFVGNDQIAHRDALDVTVPPATTVHLFQALSGG